MQRLGLVVQFDYMDQGTLIWKKTRKLGTFAGLRYGLV